MSKTTTKFIQTLKRKPVIVIIIIIVIISIGLVFRNQLFGINGDGGGSTVPMITTRAKPSNGATVGYGYVNIGGSVSIDQYYATSRTYISTVTVKWWPGHDTSDKQTIFSETLASNTYSSWSKTKPVYLLFYTSPSAPSGEYHVSIVVTTSGATAYGTKSASSTFKVELSPGTSPTETTTTEGIPGFEIFSIPIAFIVLLCLKNNHKKKRE